MAFPILTLIMLSPFIGAGVVLLIPKDRHEAIKVVALAFSIVSLALSFFVFAGYNTSVGGFQFVEQSKWIPELGIGYKVGVDGFSAPQLLLTGIVMVCAVLVSWSKSDRPREFFAFLQILVGGVFGAFMALDLFLFLIFYEMVLFPVYVLVASWGTGRKEYAAMKLTIYLFLGSLVAIIGVLAVYFQSGGSFDFEVIQKAMAAKGAAGLPFQQIWFLPVFIGFGVLASIWPLHNWSPDGYASAPTAVSMLHGGVLKATGAYAALRFGIQLMPEGAKFWLPFVVFLCLANVIYAGAVAFRQKDLKYIIGFASVAHLGLVLLGLCALNAYGLNGAGYELFAGGVMTGLMFAIVGMIYERSHERNVDKLDGLARVMPLAAVGFVIGSLAAMGMPGLPGFVAEIQIFMGLWQASQQAYLPLANTVAWWYGSVAIAGVLTVVITAAWTLKAGAKIFFSEPQTPEWQKLPGLNALDKVAIVFMCAILIIAGVFPNSVMSVVSVGVQAILKTLGVLA